jgi:hypothetical protein
MVDEQYERMNREPWQWPSVDVDPTNVEEARERLEDMMRTLSDLPRRAPRAKIAAMAAELWEKFNRAAEAAERLAAMPGSDGATALGDVPGIDVPGLPDLDAPGIDAPTLPDLGIGVDTSELDKVSGAMADWQRKADALKDRLKTPLDHLQDGMREAAELFNRGLIDETTLNEALDHYQAAIDDLEKGKEEDESRLPAPPAMAMEKGSVAERAALDEMVRITRAFGTDTPKKDDGNKTEKEHLDEAKVQTELLEQMAVNSVGLMPLGIPGV